MKGLKNTIKIRSNERESDVSACSLYIS